MKKNIGKYLLMATLLGSTTMFTSCDNGLAELNENPNSPEIVPTYTIFNGATRYLMATSRDGWWSARMSMPWMQYTAQINYTEEDKYQYRDTQTSGGWNALYRSASNFKDIIDKCTNPATAAQMGQYGDLDNQIAISRIMLAYTFDQLVSSFGDVPYWSHGNKNADFQALQIDDYAAPKYVSQQVIYEDLLKELKEASEQLDVTGSGFSSGDNIYGGDVAKWKKFANSLRLRIANRVKAKLPSANAHITDAIAKGVFTSNDDNAAQNFGSSAAEGSPFWATFFTGSMRTDFATNKQFINLLKGQSTKNFGVDPRLQAYAAPTGLKKSQVYPASYQDSDDLTKYQGMPYGLPSAMLSSNNDTSTLSFASKYIMTPTYGEVLMEYAEVEFILSEINGWDATHYKTGVQASMDKWGVDASKAAAYVSALPVANQENVITQKYLALYMQGAEAWNEYRRTGFPNGGILLLPGQSAKDNNGATYTFTPLMSGNVVAKDLPARVRYPITQPSLNGANYKEASSRLSNGDEIDSKLFFAK
ncbi:SusD/RagB family nutrient-binding outer membrane lipoprotein [Empedobacter sp. UBA5987]|uniref:SusD/RagB family nutrient-binding outer membrane lipoprotein n=1 Tax=Empedobacter sp. UBA5987 TaxID=1946444 RepID=UPI0025BABFD4|nr:SusD/RagB family nutrient-binding outer membrane lipoprotein [Empedobacter sp. UBA5987]